MSALSGIKVLDLSRVLAGPSCTQTLADLGATVWKIESLQGDETRTWGPPFLENGLSAYYTCVNRNKQSLAINLKDTQGQQIVQKLAAQADILVENFKVGDLERYGLDYERLSKTNPGLIYASITGFGQTGPRASEPGYDAALQGHTGIMSVTGEPGGPPMKVGVAWIDLMTGMNATTAILAALFERSRSGLGQHLDLSLFDTGICAMANLAQSYLVTQKSPKSVGNAHAQIVPYGSFPASDGWLVIAVGNDRQYQALTEVLCAPELWSDPRFQQNASRVAHRAELVSCIEGITRTESREFWLKRLSSKGIPSAPVNNLEEAFNDPQTQARNLQVSWEGQSTLGSPFFHLSRTPAELRSTPPLLGQHTREVLEQALGMDSKTVSTLLESGVLGSIS